MQQGQQEREGGTGQAVQVQKDPKRGALVQGAEADEKPPGTVAGQLELPCRNATTEIYFSEFWRLEAKARCRQGQGLPRALPSMPTAAFSPGCFPPRLCCHVKAGPHAGQDNPGAQGTDEK